MSINVEINLAFPASIRLHQIIDAPCSSCICCNRLLLRRRYLHHQNRWKGSTRLHRHPWTPREESKAGVSHSCSWPSKKSSGGQEDRNPTGYQRPLWANGGRTIRWKNKRSAGDGRQGALRNLREICQPMLMDKQRLMRLQLSTESIQAQLHSSWQGPIQRSSNLDHWLLISE